MKWLKENWFLVLVGVVVFVLISAHLKNRAGYEQQIDGLNTDIAILKEDIKQSEKRVQTAEAQAVQLEQRAEEKVVEAQREAQRRAELERERNRLRDLVASKTPTEVVERTREILVCTEVTLTTLGVVLSEVCARENLFQLEDRVYLKAELERALVEVGWQAGAIGDLKGTVERWKEVSAEKDVQLLSKEEVIKDVERKLVLEQSFRRSKVLKSFLVGAAVGAVIGVVVFR